MTWGLKRLYQPNSSSWFDLEQKQSHFSHVDTTLKALAVTMGIFKDWSFTESGSGLLLQGFVPCKLQMVKARPPLAAELTYWVLA